MAAPTALDRARTKSAEDDLTDEQIEELLARATNRVQAKAASKPTRANDISQERAVSKLNTGALKEPYILSKGDVTTFDAARLANTEKQPKKGNGIRVVQNPGAVKRMADEVCTMTPCVAYERRSCSVIQ